MSLDFFCTDGAISSYLSTAGRRLSEGDQAIVTAAFSSGTIAAAMDLREGAMRIRLPDEFAAQIILALQQEEAVTITIGAARQTFQPEQFSLLFDKFKHQTNHFFDSFKGSTL